MSDTLRTDAAETIIPSNLSPEEQHNRNGEYVSKDDMREIERELAAANDMIVEMQSKLDWIATERNGLLAEVKSLVLVNGNYQDELLRRYPKP